MLIYSRGRGASMFAAVYAVLASLLSFKTDLVVVEDSMGNGAGVSWRRGCRFSLSSPTLVTGSTAGLTVVLFYIHLNI